MICNMICKKRFLRNENGLHLESLQKSMFGEKFATNLKPSEVLVWKKGTRGDTQMSQFTQTAHDLQHKSS